jgi:hypothetical protein
MSSNQVGGFFNRLEASRKYLFGSVGVLGKANDSIISGALITRGQDIKPTVEVAPDCTSLHYISRVPLIYLRGVLRVQEARPQQRRGQGLLRGCHVLGAHR